MHFEILVEDASGKIALEFILKKILGSNVKEHSYRIIAYKGIGRLPKNLRGDIDPRKRILLDRLPKLLKAYGKSLRYHPSAVIVVLDLDDKDCHKLKTELLGVLDTCNPKPVTLFRIAIEELEAWYLGDKTAITNAYPKARESVFSSYTQDSICGTWEKLADSIYPGGSQKLKQEGWPKEGQVKCDWAKHIAPLLNIDNNNSKSFQVFRDGIRKIAGLVN